MRQNEKEKEPKSLDIVFDCALSKLQFQSDHWNSIDQKNAIVLAVYGIILAIFLAAGVSDVVTPYKKLVLGAWLFTVIIGIACNLISLMPRDIDMPPKIDSLINKYLNKEIADTKAIMLSSIRESISKNNSIMEKKSTLMSFSIKICLPIALGFSVIAVLLKILKG